MEWLKLMLNVLVGYRKNHQGRCLWIRSGVAGVQQELAEAQRNLMMGQRQLAQQRTPGATW